MENKLYILKVSGVLILTGTKENAIKLIDQITSLSLGKINENTDWDSKIHNYYRDDLSFELFQLSNEPCKDYAESEIQLKNEVRIHKLGLKIKSDEIKKETKETKKP